MVDDFMLDKLLDKIKEIIGTETFDDIKILIDTYDIIAKQCWFKKCCDVNDLHYKRWW